MELQTLSRQLAESDRSAKTKVEAATILLSKDYPQATVALHNFLADATNRSAQIAICEAISLTGMGREVFVEPLFVMLKDADPLARTAAAGALATYKSDVMLSRLSELVRDSQASEPVRISGILALSRVLDKQSVDTLISLLEVEPASVQVAAAEGLARLTGIRSFGGDAQRWKQWWLDNEDKSREQWLSDLADILARQNTALEVDNARLRTRLTATTNELYNLTAPSDRADMLLALARDPMPDMRLIGMQLANRRTAASQPHPPEMTELVRALLSDDTPAIRAEAALLLGGMGDAEAPGALLRRLEIEPSSAVRQAIITSLGNLRVQEAFGPLIKAIVEEANGSAAAAAVAIQRLADQGLLDDARRAQAADALIERFMRSETSQPDLREAILSAMSVVRDARFAAVMRTALDDRVATVRLAAVRGLRAMNDADSINAIAALVSDSDRGVRMAAITTVGNIGSLAHLNDVLSRTRTDIESDSAVRQQAWDVSLDLLNKAPTAQLAATAKLLAGRADATNYEIRLLTMLLERLADQPDQQVEVRLELARSLQESGRLAEAATQIDFVRRNIGDPARADELWLSWIELLLAADDASIVTHISAQSDAQQTADAVDSLLARLNAHVASGRNELVITLAEQAMEQLAELLSDSQRQALTALRDQARQQQIQADRARVGQLVQQLASTDATVRSVARTEMESLPPRAALPLVEQLRMACQVEPSVPDIENAICSVLSNIAPELTGYNPTASVSDKLLLVDSWLNRLADNR